MLFRNSFKKKSENAYSCVESIDYRKEQLSRDHISDH